ncbi:O-succinylbenzoate synthase [Naumannella cuiyingiana]|uniref:o-succinylbenzoate synthase n=1 Tax=Naumannella cuiyingiana TaxID=1347891 RepID=A0A7Z0D8L0_9ACTN|nr:o-succinylbenzoate synthase [Naumannella cuiyingiana]NYI70943.1 O-succinylbenzoate synthase [Naumannella cuiyingiana]
MRIVNAELHQVELPLRSAFRTSFGHEVTHALGLLRIETEDAVGWGECVAPALPHYSSEYLGAELDVIERHLLPLIGERELRAATIAEDLHRIRGHRMAKSCVETAVLDAELRGRGDSLSTELGGVRERVPCGVSVGIQPSIGELLDIVAGYLAAGYLRIKLKIEPGWDLEPVAAVREKFGPDLILQADANAAYELSDLPHLRRLDRHEMIMLEQPLASDELLGHAELAAAMTTPICLDESITSARAALTALRLGACSVINIKPGRVGGYLESRRIHDLCRSWGVQVWCGGMLESGIGRAANLALASLPGFTLPNDISATERYYERDLTEPFTIADGQMAVPTGPGIGIDPDPAALADFTVRTSTIR